MPGVISFACSCFRAPTLELSRKELGPAAPNLSQLGKTYFARRKRREHLVFAAFSAKRSDWLVLAALLGCTCFDKGDP